MELIKNMIRALFPRGVAWRLPNYWDVLVASWATAIADAKLWMEQVHRQRHPKTSDDALNDWGSVLGVAHSTTLNTAQKQAQLEAIDTASGGQDLVYLNRQLQLVYPMCWIERIDLDENEMGNDDAEFGVSNCGGGEFSTESSDEFLYYVRGVARLNEQQGLQDLIARLCPAHMLPIWLVQFLNQEAFDAKVCSGC